MHGTVQGTALQPCASSSPAIKAKSTIQCEPGSLMITLLWTVVCATVIVHHHHQMCAYKLQAASSGTPRARLEKSSSLPAAEADSTARIMASLSRAASSSHSLENTSSSSDGEVAPSSKASFTSQRSGSPFTAKRDKSFLDVQRFLGDSLSKSASKGKSIAKQLQVSLYVPVSSASPKGQAVQTRTHRISDHIRVSLKHAA